jgi:hypothetical protein
MLIGVLTSIFTWSEPRISLTILDWVKVQVQLRAGSLLLCQNSLILEDPRCRVIHEHAVGIRTRNRSFVRGHEHVEELCTASTVQLPDPISGRESSSISHYAGFNRPLLLCDQRPHCSDPGAYYSFSNMRNIATA